MAMSKGSRLLSYVNARMRVTIQDGRVLVGVFMAFDKHMNLVLGDCEEFRRAKGKNAETGKAEEREEKRFLGLVLLRGENVVSLQVEAMPRAAKGAAAAAGPGAGRAAGRGMAISGAGAGLAGLHGPVRGVGGPSAAMMMQGPGPARPPVLYAGAAAVGAAVMGAPRPMMLPMGMPLPPMPLGMPPAPQFPFMGAQGFPRPPGPPPV